MPLAGDDIIERDPFFTGRPGRTSEPFDTRKEAMTYRNSLISGGEDDFLGRAWDRVKVSQNHGPGGQFAKGFTVSVEFVRPGPGDQSGGGAPVFAPEDVDL